jgi:hypothetical protein
VPTAIKSFRMATGPSGLLSMPQFLNYATEMETQMMRRVTCFWNGVRCRTHADTKWTRLASVVDVAKLLKPRHVKCRFAAYDSAGEGRP